MEEQYRIEQFCDMDELESLLEDWSKATQMFALVRDPQGNPITKYHGLTDYCAYVNSSEEGFATCARFSSPKGEVTQCHGGLCDFAEPVTTPDGSVVATLYCGQVLLPGFDAPDFEALAQNLSLDEAELKARFALINRREADEIDAARELLSGLVNSLVTRNYNAWVRSRETTTDRTLSQLTQMLYGYNITLDLETGEYSLIEGTGLPRTIETFRAGGSYSEVMDKRFSLIHPSYADKAANLLSLESLSKTETVGFIGTLEFPMLYPDTDAYEWHEANVFIEESDGHKVANILGRNITEAHELQERSNRELRAAAAKNEILSDLTKMLYSYNITLNLSTGKYSLIEGTGMTRVMNVFRSTDDYPTAYAQKIRYVQPDYMEQFAAIASMESLRGHKDSHGFIGSLEYGAESDHGTEWHEINVFISSDEMGNPIANILGRDITESHKRVEQREIAQRAAVARDQLLSGVTKMLYSFNITVNLETWTYSLITGTGCAYGLGFIQNDDDYMLSYNKVLRIMTEDSIQSVKNLFSVEALKKHMGQTGYVDTIITAAVTPAGTTWQEANLFMGTNENGEPIANILGRDITASHNRQADRERELRAAAAKDAILSEITQALYSFNLTVDLETGSYTLITGTGMDDTVAFFSNTNDYPTAFSHEADTVIPKYALAFAEYSLEGLRAQRETSGHIGQIEYGVNSPRGIEWHELNAFIGVGDHGQPVANVLGRDVTEAHEAIERRERELRAASARDQLLSGVTKMLYSYNLTVNVETGHYTIITGTGLNSTVATMVGTDNYAFVVDAFKKKVDPAYLEKGLNLLSLDNYRGDKHLSGYIATEEFPVMQNGEVEWHEINVFSGFGANGEPVINVLGRDVTEAHEKADTKAQLEIATKASEAKTSFLFNMSHDIRTPMNAIMGFTELLERHQENPERRADYLHKIRESSEVLLSIINNVLEMARIEKGAMTLNLQAWSAEQFNDTLFSVFHDMMQAKDIEFTRSIDVHNHYVLCDPIKLREVFINILSNAYKYTEVGGRVRMDLKEIDCDRPGYALYQTTITDTGIGMAADFLPHLFEEFTREHTSTENKVEGTGLGMPIVKRLVDLMEGTIEVQSEVGVGTTFVVTIPHPLADRSDLSDFDRTEVENANFEGKRILLAEDNDLNAEIAYEILTEVGFVVERAEDGQICVDMVQQADAGYFDLILMDIQMPNMNGYEATRAIRTLPDPSKSRIPIFAMTANAFEEDKRNARNAGMEGHLAKPIDIDELMKTLSRVLG